MAELSELEVEQRCAHCDLAVVVYQVRAAAIDRDDWVTAAKADARAAAHEDLAVANHLPWEPQVSNYGPSGPPQHGSGE